MKDEELQREIQERKQVEEELRESEERYRTLAENSPVGIWVITADGYTIYLNPAMCSMLEIASLEELAGRTYHSFFTPESLENMAREHAKCRQAVASGYEVEIVGKRGRNLHVLIYDAPLMSADGKLKRLIGTFIDITELKRAKEESIRSATAVKQAPESIIITDTDGTIQYVNPAFELVTGYSRGEAIGKNSRILQSGKHHEAFYQAMWDTIARGEIWSGHFINKREDGTLFEEEATISPIKNDYGEITNYVAVKRDVTHEVRLEAQFSQAQKMEAVGTLAGGLAHDFNNLLQAIQGNAQLVLFDSSEDQPGFQELQEIIRAADRGAELTQQLLTFSRKVKSEKRPLSLNQHVMAARNLLVRTIPKMIEVELQLADEPGNVNADPVQIEQIIMNLAVNAADAMPERGRLTIRTENERLDEHDCQTQLAAQPGDYMVLIISDNGHGMDEETLEHIFDPFYTTKEIGKGTGLGLAMVYGIVKNHKGYITCSTESGKGTAFKIYLPVIEQETEMIEANKSESSLEGGTETVLLVDDEDSVRNLGFKLLGKAGYTVLNAADGESALELYRKEQERIDLVVLDLNMPGMGGRKCLEELMKIDPQAQVLIASGYCSDSSAGQTLELGAKGFVRKPYKIRQMLEAVREVLDQAITA